MGTMSTTEFAHRCGKTSRTIINWIDKGKISATRIDSEYRIDESEFYRIFPEKFEEKNEKFEEKDEKYELEKLKMELDFIKKERNFLKEQLEKSEERERKITETLQKTTLLIEHKTKRKKLFGIF